MKLKYLVLFIFLPFVLSAQEYVFFSDSPDNTYYDPSFGFYSNSSVLALVNENKIPVDVNYKYSGANSLRLRWKSSSGGDWGAAVAEEDWIPHDITIKDSITFQTFSFSVIDSSALPSIYLEDTQNRKTPKLKISGFISRFEEDKWVRISIPLSPFKQSPGDADLTDIKTIYFGQDNPDGVLHTIYLDEIRVKAINDTDTVAPDVPIGLAASVHNLSITLTWTPNSEDDLAGYRIYRAGTGDYELIGSAVDTSSSYIDYTGTPPKTYSYKISAYDLSGNESGLSSEVSASTSSLPDSILLDMVQEATFKYFWDFGHPVSGLARDRFGGSDEIVTSGGSGFGVMAILVGIERGYITRDQGVQRVLKILNFLTNNADRFHGVYPHWLNGTTGDVIPFSSQDNGGDLVETAFLIQGLLTARQYFNQSNSDEEQIRNLITAIWEAVEWDWYRKDNGNFLYWHWSPNYGWAMNFPLRGPNETMITYLLAIASPTHPIPASLYHDGWASSSNYVNGNSYYGIPLYVGWPLGGPLFFAHYSFLGFDPREKKDIYANYFINNRNHTLINRAYCIANPHNYPGYDADTWGLTASDSPPPTGYSAHEPNNDNGTISPTAALSSMPYTPEESIEALKSFYYEYGSNLWGQYGFKDAFNLSKNWFAGSYLAIDQGPIIIMIENYRSQLLWNNFMANPEIQPMLDAIGFVPDVIPVELTSFTGISDNGNVILKWSTASEINNRIFEIERTPLSPPFDKGGKQGGWVLVGFVDGKGSTTEYQDYSFSDKNVPAGKYFYRLKQIDFDGTYEYSNVIEVDATGPLSFDLKQNYPNPFNPETTIEFLIEDKGPVTLKLFDVLGNEVVTLVDELKEAGLYKFNFNAADFSENKKSLSSGIYFYVLNAGGKKLSKKMCLLK